MVVLTRTQREAIEERERLGDTSYREKLTAQAEKQQSSSSYKGSDPKIVSSTNITDDTPVGVYDLEKTQTERASEYEATIIKELNKKQSLQSTEKNPQTVEQYLQANQGKDELIYFQSNDEEFKAVAIAKPKPEPKPEKKTKTKVDKSKFTPDGKISARYPDGKIAGFLTDGVEGYKDAFFGAFKSGFKLKPYSGGTGNIQTESGLTTLGYTAGSVGKIVTLSPAVWEGLGYNVAKYTTANPQYQPYLTGVSNFFSSRPIKTTLWTLYGVGRSVDLAQETRADGSVGFSRSGLGTTAGLSTVLGVGSGVRQFQSTVQTTPYIDSIKLDTVSQGKDFKTLLTAKGGVIVGSEGQVLRNIPYKEAQVLTGTAKNVNYYKLGNTKISLDKVNIDSRGITNLGGKVNKVNTNYKVVSGSNVETVTKPVKVVTESGKTTKYTVSIGKTSSVYNLDKVTASSDDVLTGFNRVVGKDTSSYTSINYGKSSQIDGTFKGSVGKTSVKYPYTENINTNYDLPKFSTGNLGVGTTQVQASSGTISKVRLKEILGNLDKATSSLTKTSRTDVKPIAISKTPETVSPSGSLKSPTVSESKTSTTSKTYNIVTPVSFAESKPKQENEIKPITEPITEPISEQEKISRSRSKTRFTPSQESTQRARALSDTSQESLTRQRTNISTQLSRPTARSNITSIFSNKTVSIIPPPSGYGLPPLSVRPSAGASGYNVLVKSRGIFKRVNPSPLSEADAIQYGAKRVGTTASATFKLQKTGETIKGTTSAKGNLRDFYRKGSLYIEKRGRRIKSAGELQEITYKGLASPKKKKRKSLFGGFKSGIF